MSGSWAAYDPTWLVQLAREQLPELVDALSRCTRASVDCVAYLRFVPGERANRPGSEWQSDRAEVLEHPEHGCLILDVLQDGRIGGVEFYDRLSGNHPSGHRHEAN